MKFSIIIPVYNVELYLKKCFDSVISQTFKNFEMVVVNDGSKDSSKDIIDEYANKYKFIKVINKENAGLSAARNDGMLNAQGDYIIFLDSDDYWIDNTVLGKLDNYITKNICDLYIFEYNSYDCIHSTNKPTLRFLNNCVVSSHEDIKKLLESNLYKSSAWNKIIRRNMILENNIFFINGIKSEDIDWSLRILLNAKKIGMIKVPVLTYLENRNGSITSSVNEKHCVDYLGIIERCCKYVGTNDSIYLNYVAYQFIILMGHISSYPILMKDAKKYKWLLNKSKLKKVKYICLCVKLIGFENTCRFLNNYLYKYRRKINE